MFAKNYHLHWIAGRANMLSKFIIVFQFQAWLLRYYFQKLQLLVVKNFELIFAALYFYIYELKNVSQIFKILFQTGDINIFVLRGVFVSRYVQIKSSFSGEKNISHEIRDTLQQRSYRKLTWQSIKGKFHRWQKLELCKVIHSAKLRKH